MEESEIGVGVEGVSSVTNSIASTLKAERLSCIDVSLNQFIQITHAVNNEPPPVVPVQPVQPVLPVLPALPALPALPVQQKKNKNRGKTILIPIQPVLPALRGRGRGSDRGKGRGRGARGRGKQNLVDKKDISGLGTDDPIYLSDNSTSSDESSTAPPIINNKAKTGTPFIDAKTKNVTAPIIEKTTNVANSNRGKHDIKSLEDVSPVKVVSMDSDINVSIRIFSM